MDQLAYFASEAAHTETANPTLLSALGIDGMLLVLQAGAFLVLVIILGKFAYPPIMKALEQRRKTIEEGLAAAKQAEEKLTDVEQRVDEAIRAARGEAREIIAHSKKEATTLLAEAEARAQKRAEAIVSEAKASVHAELTTAREALKKETAALVAQAAGHVIKEKLSTEQDSKLIVAALKEAE
jgi:F-type H+-transporting ATPase subunit b